MTLLVLVNVTLSVYFGLINFSISAIFKFFFASRTKSIEDYKRAGDPPSKRVRRMGEDLHASEGSEDAIFYQDNHRGMVPVSVRDSTECNPNTELY